MSSGSNGIRVVFLAQRQREGWRSRVAPGITHGMTTMKIAVSLPGATLRRAKRAVQRGEAASLSAFVAEAIEQRTTLEDLDTMLDEMLAETGGPATAAESRAARRALRGPTRRRAK